MSLLVHHQDMTADDVISCSYAAMAIVSLCRHVADGLSEHKDRAAQLAGEIGTVLKLAEDLMIVVHDVVEMHEGVIAKAAERPADLQVKRMVGGERHG